MPFRVTSSAFADGDAIPARFTCDGRDLSPPLEWHDSPAGTRTFALVLDDPDAPSGTFTHWLLWDIAAERQGLAEGVESRDAGTPGTNDFSRLGYGGPCPPKRHDAHRYRFQLYALDRRLELPLGSSRTVFDAALRRGVLASAVLQGRYRRQ